MRLEHDSKHLQFVIVFNPNTKEQITLWMTDEEYAKATETLHQLKNTSRPKRPNRKPHD